MLKSIQFFVVLMPILIAACTTQTASPTQEDNDGFCPHGHICPKGNCIQKESLCDGVEDCNDGSDETGCSQPGNEGASTQCNGIFCKDNNNCYTQEFICDGEYDCPDLTDEQNCTEVKCSSTEFKCRQRNKCISNDRVCDHTSDCGDHSDEENCQTPAIPPCAQNEFSCHSTMHKCIHKQQLCDGISQCADSSDERNCPRHSPLRCDRNELKCRSNTQCFQRRHRCDGMTDCSDGSDELDCPNRTTRTTTLPRCPGFQCRFGKRCISIEFRCDGIQHCGDFSDELDCPPQKRPPTTALSCSEFKCNSTNRCIPNRYICDGRQDCEDSSDESNCRRRATTRPTPRSCSRNQFKCNKTNRCIPNRFRCDNINDCGDNSDEINCHNRRRTTTAMPSFVTMLPGHRCIYPYISCLNGYACVLPELLCNGQNDCGDNSDEKNNCPTTTTTPGTTTTERNVAVDCGDVNFACDNKQCIPPIFVCDGDDDCGDGSDERNCRRNCAINEFRCGNDRCVNGNRRCNQIDDCGDGSDEIGCSLEKRTTTPATCQGFACPDRTCISTRYRCDGESDCSDGSDERNCKNLTNQDYRKCGLGGPISKIFGGSLAMIGQFPWMVWLNVTFPRQPPQGCGGVLINNQWVLTAAHCIKEAGIEAESVTVVIGSVDITPTTNRLTRNVRLLITHPRYSERDMIHDVGLIKLSRRVPFRKNIQVICLPDEICNNRSQYGSRNVDSCNEVKVAGWGMTGTGNISYALQTATLPTKSRFHCNTQYRKTLPRSQFCVGTGDPTVCRGDSGGPAMCVSRQNRHYVIGLVSYGDHCGSGPHPEVFSRVCYYLPWIRRQIQRNSGQRQSTSTGCRPSVLPNVEHGKFVERRNARRWRLQCDQGYRLSGSSVARCQNGSWSEPGKCELIERTPSISSTTTMVVVCQQSAIPDIPNGQVIKQGPSAVPGDTRTVVCDSGFQIDGDNVVTCQEDGQWSEPLKCNPVATSTAAIATTTTTATMPSTNCSEPLPVIENGRYRKGRDSKSRVVFGIFCNRGFVNIGRKIVRCRATGKWSPPGRCVAEDSTTTKKQRNVQITETTIKQRSGRN